VTPPPAVRPRSLWRHPDFVKLWIGQTISEIGSRITREGLPLTAVLVLHATPAQMGVVAALGGFAALVSGGLAGALAERRRLRSILIGADLGRALVLVTVPAAVALGWLNLWWLYAVVFAAGALTLLFDVAYQSIAPALLQPDQLLDGNAKLALSASTAEMIGPALTGVLVQAITAPRAILLDALSFLVSAGSVAAIRSPSLHATPPAPHASQTGGAPGLRFIASHPILRALAIRTTLTAYFYGIAGALYILYAVEYLHLKPGILGVLITLGGVGAVCGSLLAGRIGDRIPRGRVLIASAFAPALAFALVPLARGPWQLAALFLGAQQLFGDLFWPLYNVHELTIRQTATPPELLARVNAAFQFLFKVLLPLGALTGGALATAIGVRATLGVSAAGVFLSAVVLALSPVRRLR
jgi:predicted MFS family arabinose efflux permease